MTKRVGFFGTPTSKDPSPTPSVVGRIDANARKRIEPVELLILDVDGVLSNGQLLYQDKGGEGKTFFVRDGFGLHLWHKAGMKAAIISGRECGAVTRRAAELKISDVAQGVSDKAAVFEELIKKHGLTPEQTACIGDDLMDLPVMRRAGFSMAVADASEYLLSEAHYVTLAPGGRGAVREVIELILEVKGLWNKVASAYFV